MIGQRINNVELVRLMVEGGMGTIYEGVHVLMRRRFAVKVMRSELGGNSELVERFLSEAQATNEIRHPNIVEIFDAGVLPSGLPYYVMEFLEGENLAERLLQRGPLPAALALDLFLQAASALHAAHQRGIVHRDLKPENLFLTSDSRVEGHELLKVLDFGIAKLRGQVSSVRTNAGVVLGTPAYMAPEQCSGRPDDVDHRCDIYALGAILYEMLAGVPPFEHSNVMDLMMMQVANPPPPLAERGVNVPESVQRVVMKALAKAPDSRFETLSEMMAALGNHSTPVLSLNPALEGTTRVPPVARDRPASLSGAVHGERPAVTAEQAQTTAGRRQRRRRALLSLASLGCLLGVALWLNRSASQAVPVLAGLGSASSTSSSRAAQPAPASVHSLEPEVKTELKPAKSAVPEGIPSSRRLAGKRGAAPSNAMADAPRATPLELRVKSALPAASATVPSPVASAPPGQLTLDSSPWAQVFLAGRLLGSTPLVKVSLPPGRHVLTLRNPELGTSTSYAVVIQSDQAISRFVGWGED